MPRRPPARTARTATRARWRSRPRRSHGGQRGGALVDDVADSHPLVGGGESEPGVEAHVPSVITGLPAEDEGDGRKHPLVLQTLDHLDAPRREEPAPGPAARRRAAHVQRLVVEPARLWVGTAVDQRWEQVEVLAALVTHAVEVVELH